MPRVESQCRAVGPECPCFHTIQQYRCLAIEVVARDANILQRIVESRQVVLSQ